MGINSFNFERSEFSNAIPTTVSCWYNLEIFKQEGSKQRNNNMMTSMEPIQMEVDKKPMRHAKIGSIGGMFLARATFAKTEPPRSPLYLLPFETCRIATNMGKHPIVNRFDDPGSVHDFGSIRSFIRRLLEHDQWSLVAPVRVGYNGACTEAEFPVTILIAALPSKMLPSRALEIVHRAADVVYMFVNALPSLVRR